MYRCDTHRQCGVTFLALSESVWGTSCFVFLFIWSYTSPTLKKTYIRLRVFSTGSFKVIFSFQWFAIKAEILLLFYTVYICMKLLAGFAKPLLLYAVNQFLRIRSERIFFFFMFKIINLGDRDLRQPTDSLIYLE